MRFLLVFILTLLFSGCGEAILHDLDELKANQVKVALAKSGISSQKIRDGNSWRIEVGSKYTNSALRIIDESRILRRTLKRKQSGSSNSLIRTKEERTSQIAEERAYALEETLESLPGVLEAHVHIYSNEKLNLSLRKTKNLSSASVLLITEVGRNFNLEMLKKIISGGTGISSDFISVLIETVLEKEVSSQKIDVNSELSLSIESVYMISAALFFSLILLIFSFKRRASSKSCCLLTPKTGEPDSPQASVVAEEPVRNTWGEF